MLFPFCGCGNRFLLLWNIYRAVVFWNRKDSDCSNSYGIADTFDRRNSYDTMDAKNSYRSKEEKLEILKDPHIGAFALIYGVIWFLLTFGLFSEMNHKAIGLAALGYAYSRILSGLSVVWFRKAKQEGMAASAAKAAEKNVKWVLMVEGALCIAGFLLLNPLAGTGCVAVGVLCFLYYRSMAYRIFGGITGDLAGYFLQLCELWLLLTAVLLTHYF